MSDNVELPRSSFMGKLYPYVGPQELLKLAAGPSTRLHVDSVGRIASWLAQQMDTSPGRAITVTFVVLPDGLWIADRRSEHVACARGNPVLSAGELTFAFSPRQPVEIVEATNQSTGYCPEPESWPAVAAALDQLSIPRPDDFSTKMIFRRCPSCGSTNIVKNDNFVCALCENLLPTTWNYT